MTNEEIYRTLADSYERASESLYSQARVAGFNTPTGIALLTAHYTVGTMRAAALDVADKAEKIDG